MKKILFAFFLMFFCSEVSFGQSGWTKEKSNLFLSLDYQFYQSKDFNNSKGDNIITDEFKQNTVSLYGEYGLSNRFSANAHLPIYRTNGYQNTETVSGLGDLRLELKYALSKGKFPVSISVAPEFPTGAKNLQSKSTLNSFDQINLPTGDGEFNLWTTAAISHSFYPIPVYVSAFSSFNYRTKFEQRNFQNQLLSGVELGYKLVNKVWVSGKVSVLNGIGPKPKFADFIRGDGTTYTGVSFNVLYEIGKHYGINVKYFRPTDLIVKSRNNYDANIFSVGVVYSKKR